MVKVILYQKKYDDKKGESIKTELDSKEFPEPKSYEEFISDLAKAFKIKKKEIIIYAFTNDEDEIVIQDQQDLDDNKDETQEYYIILEKEESSTQKPPKNIIQEEESSSTKKIDKKVDIIKKNEELEHQKEESEDGGDIEGNGIEIKLDVNLDISDKELENMINSQIKEIPEIDNAIINDDVPFDIEKYKEEMNNKYNNMKNEFKSVLDTQINDIILNKSSLMKSKINDTILQFSEVSTNNLETIINEAQGMSEDSNNLLENTETMNKAMGEISIILEKIPKSKIEGDDEENNDKIDIRFTKQNINFEIDENEAKFINSPEIEIENIGKKTYKKLYFIRDESKSSKDFIFMENSKNYNIHQLSFEKDFTPESKGSHQIDLRINNPKQNNPYTLIIFVKEDPKKGKISGPLKIIIKIKGKEQVSSKVVVKNEEIEQKKILEEKAKSLYQEYNNKFDLLLISSQEEVINKLIEYKNDTNQIDNWIKNKFDEKDKNLYIELNLSNICDENEAKEKFKEYKYDKNKINDWIKQKNEEKNNKKAEDIYIKLNTALNFSEKINKNEVLEKIKNLEFNEEEIGKWLKEQIQEEPQQNDAQGEADQGNQGEPGGDGGDEDPRLQELVDKFDEEYNILTIIDEDEFKKVIIKLNYDEQNIRKYIEKKLNE